MIHATQKTARTTITVLIIALMAFGLSACGGSNGGETKGTVTGPAVPQEQQGFLFEVFQASPNIIVRATIRNLATGEIIHEQLDLVAHGKTTHFTPVPDVGVYTVGYWVASIGDPYGPQTWKVAVDPENPPSVLLPIESGKTKYVVLW